MKVSGVISVYTHTHTHTVFHAKMHRFKIIIKNLTLHSIKSAVTRPQAALLRYGGHNSPRCLTRVFPDCHLEMNREY